MPRDLRPIEHGAARALDLDVLVVLLDPHAHAIAGPDAAHVGRHDPQVEHALVSLAGMRFREPQRLAGVRPPAGHAEGVRDDARSGLERREKARLQVANQLWQQVHRDDARRGEIGRQHIALDEAHALADAGAARVVARGSDQVRVQLDAEATRAEAARRRNDDAAVARAEIGH